MARGGSGVNTGGNPGKGKAAPRRARPWMVNPADPSAGPARHESGGGRREAAISHGGTFYGAVSHYYQKLYTVGVPTRTRLLVAWLTCEGGGSSRSLYICG